MPRAFTESERCRIRHRLREAGRRLFSSAGVVKTSLDELTGATGIAKGSFYRFYASKELLFMDLLEESQNRIRAPLLQSRATTRRAFERLVREMFESLCDDPLVMLMGREIEFHTVIGRVPSDYLSNHQEDDQKFLESLIDKWNTRTRRPERDDVAAQMTLLLMIGLHREFLGERLLPHAVDTAVSGLADCFFTRA